MRRVVLSTLAAALAVGPWLATPASAATVDVAVRDNVFDPATRTIKVNDSVRWTWVATNEPHNVVGEFGTSQTTAAPGTVFSHTFRTPGEFTYECTVHATQMFGVITVTGPAPAPTSAAPKPTSASPRVPSASPTPSRSRTPRPTAVAASPAPSPSIASPSAVPSLASPSLAPTPTPSSQPDAVALAADEHERGRAVPALAAVLAAGTGLGVLAMRRRRA